MNLLNQDLIVVLVGYVKGFVNLQSLKEWLAENVWQLAQSPSPLDRMVLGELELALAEYDRGDRDERFLRNQIEFVLRLPNPALTPRLQELASTPSFL